MSNKLLRDFSYQRLTLLRLVQHKVVVLLTSQKKSDASAITLTCDSLMKSKKRKVKCCGAVTEYLFFWGDKTQRAMGWRLPTRGKALHLPFSIYSRKLRKGEESNQEEGESFESRHSGRWAGGFFLMEKALRLRFPFYWRKLRKGEKSNQKEGESLDSRHNERWDWRLFSRGKALHFLFSFY